MIGGKIKGKAVVIAVLLFLMGASVTYAVMRMEKSVPVYGVVTLGNAYYYLSNDGVNEFTTLPFTVNLDGSYRAEMYIVNRGKTMSAAIAWDTPSWENAVPTDLTLSWDLTTTISPNTSKLVHITMRVNRVLNPGGPQREFNYRLIVVGNVASVMG